ncbi:MAG TPA: peptidylprolyl isomerase [Terriglobales bacterium]|nr:peptidylprolyl isomerase [Terriglobales bacterium]
MRTTLPRIVTAAALALACSLSLSAQKTAPTKTPAKAAAAPAKLGPGTYAVFNTSKGSFKAQLFPKDAPKAVANFVALAEGKQPYKDPRMGTLSMAPLYQSLLFFRTIPGYLIQTGDPLNNGTGKLGYTLPFEKNSLKFDQPGRMALAQVPGDASSRGSQVFFTLKPVPALDSGGYLIIGQIVDGLDVAQALSEGARKNGAQDIPQYPNILQSVKIQVVQ